MCDCFELDPAWQGWERWYFGVEESWADELPDTERAPVESAAERELATVH